jgi:5-methylcytosine-specific restriction endonuclease McrA
MTGQKEQERKAAHYAANREKLLAEQAAYRAANREKVLERKAAHYAANREKELARNAAYRAANREKVLAHNAAWRDANREKVRAGNAAYRAANPEKARALTTKWRADNPEKHRAGRQRRRARLANVENNFTAADWRALVEVSKHCHWCRRKFTKSRKPTHDHVIPLAAGGANTPNNSVCACRECNTRKGARLVDPVTRQGILV